MANYISSNANRLYVATEASYGFPAAIQPSNRFQAAHLQCHQAQHVSKRRDKTGSRSYTGGATTTTRISRYELSVHLNSWDRITTPSYGPLIQAAMGTQPTFQQGLVVQSVNGTQIKTQQPHSLSPGFALASATEIRFVVAVTDAVTLILNVPFSDPLASGAVFGTTVSYLLGDRLPSLSLYDYWDSANSVSRLITGSGVDRFQIDVSGDVHTLIFSGPAADILDSVSGVYGVSGIQSFPLEPSLDAFNYAVVPGQLGQVWLGSPLSQVFTMTAAAIDIKNNLLVRDREFGSAYPMALVPGLREVESTFTLFAQGDEETSNLYALAKTRMPMSAMLQLGTQSGQMMGIYLPSVVPELPAYLESEPFLLWEFNNQLSQGVANNEAYIAFA